nr:cytochrome P450 [Sphingomonas sp. Y57]
MTSNPDLFELPAHVDPARLFDVDVYAPAGFETDFHEAWYKLHEANLPELIWTPRHGGHWMPTRGKLIGEMFADYTRFSNRVGAVPKELGELLRFIPNNIDPPQHRDYRTLLNSSLSPAAVIRLSGSIRALAVDLIEGVREKGRCDFKTAFAEILPIHIFLNMMDLPLSDARHLMSIATRVIRPKSVDDARDAMQAFADYLIPWIERRRDGSGTDFMTRLVSGRIGDRIVTRQEAIDLCVQVLLGGLDTVLNFLCFAMLFMARHAEHRRLLLDEPGLIPQAVDELLRRFPVLTLGREVRFDMEYAGVIMKKGDMIALPSPLHGIDALVNEHPLKVDFHRSSSDHSTFGNGPHRCPGNFLARTELIITFEEWLARIPHFLVEPGAEITYVGGVVGGMAALPLVWQV